MAKYYNGVKLPDMPEGVLAEYPYVWIRKNTTTGYYDLVFSKLQPYYNQTYKSVCYGALSGECTYYQVPIAGSDNATAWTFNSTLTTYFGLDEKRTVLWSNRDMPYNSEVVTAGTMLYIHGSEPADNNIQSKEKAYYNGILLPPIPQGVLGGYPNVFILSGAAGTAYDLVCFPNGAYRYGTELRDKGHVQCPRYRVQVSGGAATADDWTFVDRAYSAYPLSYRLAWSNHDIPDGSATATNVFYHAAEPIQESKATLVEIGYETSNRVYVSEEIVRYNANNEPLVSYVVPVEKGCSYRVTMNEVGNRLRSVLTTFDPSTVTTDTSAAYIVNDPAFAVGYVFGASAFSDGWMVVYVSNQGETPKIDITKIVAGPGEPETPPLVIGGDIRITEGMTIIGGVLHRIVLS